MRKRGICHAYNGFVSGRFLGKSLPRARTFSLCCCVWTFDGKKMMMATKRFNGARVFMSRNLVPPELFDSLHDALKLNGAEVVLCCDPSANAPSDYHIISSADHEKFEDLRSKGCNLLGPQCVLTCAKEHRLLPKQGFTCCLAMDGVKVLASGFEMDEKVKIEKMVNSMGGVLHTKASSDISFVILKNVLAAKYKWALNILKKPIVTLSWLYQCWTEHRLVPQEPYKVLPFSGLTICVTRIPADDRKKMEKIIIQNGGKYSAELTRKCTHLISDVADGDKYKVAQRWGHIHIVTRKWFDQSLSRRACLNEDSYHVQASPTSVHNVKSLTTKCFQDKCLENSESAPSSMAGESNLQAFPRTGISDPDLETTVSQNISSAISDAPIFDKEDKRGMHTAPHKNEMNVDGCVADDSQDEGSDLYLSDCRISLVGFEATEMRKLVNMVRGGGGSRYMSFNEKLTHIVVGNPSELEKKEVRGLAALGVIHVVRANWLEDCERERKEIPVLQRHIAHDLLLPKDPVCSNKGGISGMPLLGERKDSTFQSCIPVDRSVGCGYSGSESSMEKIREAKLVTNMRKDSSLEVPDMSTQQSLSLLAKHKLKDCHSIKPDSAVQSIKDEKVENVFGGKLFRFSNLFPEDRRAEIVEWVKQGSGEVVDELYQCTVHFTIERHGVVLRSANGSTYVSSHWIRSCLEDGCLLDVGSHVLYSPLPCQIPLPGFQSFRLCVSQYEEKDRVLLRNLCFVLGAKFVEKLTKKVTHLLCKFTNGPKYEAACKWGIKSVTSEWICACVNQDKVVATTPFCPKEVTTQDQEAGLCTVSQYPSQAARMVSGDDPCIQNFSRNLRKLESQATSSKVDSSEGDVLVTSDHSKRARLLKDHCLKTSSESEAQKNSPVCGNYFGNVISEGTLKVPLGVPDVAAAIEDLLEQTSKIQDLKSPERAGSDKSHSPECLILGKEHGDPPAFSLSKHWLNRTEKRIDFSNPSGDVKAGAYDGFSETQTESQVVGYEEDLSGRQMIIDRVRAQSSMT